jgi:hypothetical protein
MNVTGAVRIVTANASRDLGRHSRGPIFELRNNIRVSVQQKLRQ